MSDRTFKREGSAPPPRTSVASYYLESPEIPEDGLEEALDLLPLRSPSLRPKARDQLIEILEEFHTLQKPEDRVLPVRARRSAEGGESEASPPDRPSTRTYVQQDLSPVQDLKDLDSLEGVIDELDHSADLDAFRKFVDLLGDVRAANPVLIDYRLCISMPSEFRSSGLNKRIREHQIQPEYLREIVDRYRAKISLIRDQVNDERSNRSRRSKRPDYASLNFVVRCFHFWRRFTGKGTSRHGRDGNDSGPFGQFTTKAGSCIQPGFSAKRLSREVHEALRDEPAWTSGDPHEFFDRSE